MWRSRDNADICPNHGHHVRYCTVYVRHPGVPKQVGAVPERAWPVRAGSGRPGGLGYERPRIPSADSSSEIPLWRFSDSCNHGMSSNGEASQSPTAPKCSTEHAPPSTGASSGRTIGHLGHLQSPEQAAPRWLRTRSRPYRWWNHFEYVYSFWRWNAEGLMHDDC